MANLLETANAVVAMLSDINAKLSFQEDLNLAGVTARTVLVIPEDVSYAQVTRNTSTTAPVVRINIIKRCLPAELTTLLAFSETTARRFENCTLATVNARCSKIEFAPAYSEKLWRDSHVFYSVIRLTFNSK